MVAVSVPKESYLSLAVLGCTVAVFLLTSGSVSVTVTKERPADLFVTVPKADLLCCIISVLFLAVCGQWVELIFLSISNVLYCIFMFKPL